jgi:hypothetical protein
LPGFHAKASTFGSVFDESKRQIQNHLKSLAEQGKSIPIEWPVTQPPLPQYQGEASQRATAGSPTFF